MPLYFAYGSNMDREAMARRCPASKPLDLARLPRHRLVVMSEGYASVVRDPRRTVWGLLWDLALADVPALDRYEGVAGGLYTKVHQAVIAEAGSRRALVYVGRDPGPGMPRPGYVEAVLAAGRSAGLPEGYLREIEALSPRVSKADPAKGFAAIGFQLQPAAPKGREAGTVTPRRTSPLEPERDPSAGWSWDG
ncbi:gamma-glutamylcyclotransferase [Enterovirga sp. DB1703]|uniref:Gamma-glutamylcyclotransferase n=1 Tax=Enterovirga aerilata TaxID=2730920 RepID=A0A849I689_9HYPH|nr:gamma-glutamylcyclotransferase family protein [Enterovirga sp. DB1703]NNM72898.1 gamma-glutamylcyclotransferase [Enterovirga sp. DB1703]